MKNTVTARLRAIGFTPKQIKRTINHLNYRGFKCYAITSIEITIWNSKPMLRFLDGEVGEIIETSLSYLKGE